MFGDCQGRILLEDPSGPDAHGRGHGPNRRTDRAQQQECEDEQLHLKLRRFGVKTRAAPSWMQAKETKAHRHPPDGFMKAGKLRSVMFYRLFGGLWRAFPSGLRRFFIRRVQSTFTVSAAAVVVNEAGKILVLHHILRPTTGWGLPGGFIDTHEQPSEAIVRELKEETGININDVRMLYVRTLGRHIEILFAATAEEEGEIRSAEIDHVGWYAFDELPANLPARDKQTIERLLKGEI